MSNLFKTGSDTQATVTPSYSGLDVQTSSYGKCVPMVFGANRIAPNLMWYGDFISIPHVSQPASGGKGGSLFGGGGSGGAQVSYTYKTAVAMALCEGPIEGIGRVFQDKTQTTLEGLNLTEFLGTYPQTPWTYFLSQHPSSAFGYNGIAYVASSSFDLGSSAQLGNHTFEVFGIHSYSISDDIPDADASLVIETLLTDPHCGLTNFPWLGDLTDYQNYCIATGLWISPSYETQQATNTMLQDIVTATNSEIVWSSGELRIVPYGDEEITGNGKTYTPPPFRYDLTDDDFLPDGSSAGGPSSPVLISRKRPSDMLNTIRLECLDRENQYNALVVEAKDQAAIDTYGLRSDSLRDAHIFCDPQAASISAQLGLQRQSVANTYSWSTDLRYVLLDPMDLVTLTHAGQELDRVPVRIKTISRSGNVLNFTAEEYLSGVASAAEFSFQTGQGFAADYNTSPGDAEAPLMWEPTDQLAGGLQVWLATSGGSNWGGCEVWIATESDGEYTLAGRITGKSRYGTLRDTLPTVVQSITSKTLDETNTLKVQISQGQLLSGTPADASSFNTLCYVGGEYVSYANSTLVGAEQYDLTYLFRGAMGTDPANHPSGTPFARIDDTTFKYPYTQDRINTTIYVKLLSFNLYGVAKQSLAEVSPYTYVITGVALASPLPDVTEVRCVFEAGFQKIWWDDITDFRTGIRYRIYKGDTFDGAQSIGDCAHPPFVAFGPGTYWIEAYCQPVAGLLVRSETPQSIAIAGNMLVANLLYTSDQKALGWPGSFDNTAKEGSGSSAVIRLVGSGNILADTNVLDTPDILNDGGVVASGNYEISPSDYVDTGYIAENYVNASWLAQGVPVGQDILSVPDILNMPDVLGSASTQYISAWIEIATANEGDGNIYDSPDVFSEPDAYSYGIPWGPWQRFVPGVYLSRFIKFRVVLETEDPLTVTYVTAFSWEVSVPPRIDHYQNLTILAAGRTVEFEPDNATTPSPFNGGPAGQANPYVNVTWQNQEGDQFVIDALTPAFITFHFENAGVPVQRNGVNLTAEGY